MAKPTAQDPGEQSPGNQQPPAENAATVVKLNNKETAQQYECTYTQDVIVHVPGHNYRGRISDVPPHIAEILITQGHKAFVKKGS
jgi:hypothetical protein